MQKAEFQFFVKKMSFLRACSAHLHTERVFCERHVICALAGKDDGVVAMGSGERRSKTGGGDQARIQKKEEPSSECSWTRRGFMRKKELEKTASPKTATRIMIVLRLKSISVIVLFLPLCAKVDEAAVCTRGSTALYISRDS